MYSLHQGKAFWRAETTPAPSLFPVLLARGCSRTLHLAFGARWAFILFCHNIFPSLSLFSCKIGIIAVPPTLGWCEDEMKRRGSRCLVRVWHVAVVMVGKC